MKYVTGFLKDFSQNLIIFCILAYVFSSLILFGSGALIGFVEGKGPSCSSKMRRIEYVNPFFRVGCWVTGEP